MSLSTHREKHGNMSRQDLELTAEEAEDTNMRGKKLAIDQAAELAQEGSPTAEAEPGAAAAPEAPSEIEQLKAERDQLVDRLARLQAEFENARKRAERERIENREFVTGSVVEQFLPVLDNFDLALKATGSAEQLRSGVTLIVKQM